MTTALSTRALSALAERTIRSLGATPERQLARTLAADHGSTPERVEQAIALSVQAGRLERAIVAGALVVRAPGEPGGVRVGRIDASRLTPREQIRTGAGVHVGKWPPPPGCECTGCTRKRKAEAGIEIIGRTEPDTHEPEAA